ncbi:hypothetical protein PV327_004958 [Microctonus hyperodae]|uniref:Cathepsin O n=1 Tax=Microctonus hyperodae TaxID=165561 RepID=A0AA39FDI9_MICHY|nr:hypothetical protein PV327_004958 [Microctonus hyperodae]
MEWRTILVTILVISLCFLAIPIKVPSKNHEENVRLFESYILHYNKSYRYNPSEYEKRFERFQKSLENIRMMNSKRLSVESAFYGPTVYSDMSEEEFLTLALRPNIPDRGLKYVKGRPHHRTHHTRDSNVIRFERAAGIPMKLDWRTKDVVTRIKNQGNCGACWAYSTVECVESIMAIKNGTLRSFSVQEMIDCAGNKNFGCEGGDICNLLSWLVDNQVSILAESLYPVTGTSDVCQLNRLKTSTVQVTDFTCDSFIDSENEMLEILANHGPIAAAVNALTWQNYLGGIIQFHCDGEFSKLNHAVQIVGYDKTGTTPFYIVRNSWGEYFGHNGYLYIAIGGNMCGIANQVSTLNVIW